MKKKKERNPFDEREFLDFARQYLSQAFPNPERSGCPPEEALRSSAHKPAQENEAVSEHLSYCSPCLKRYIELFEEARIASRKSKT